MIKFTISFVLFGFAAQAQVVPLPVIEFIAPNGGGFSLGVDDISNVTVNDNVNFNQITFTINDIRERKFATLTMANVGKRVSILICGEEVSSPMIQTPIFGGGLALVGFKRDKAEMIGDVLTGRRSCY